jgi:hypothetical protein
MRLRALAGFVVSVPFLGCSGSSPASGASPDASADVVGASVRDAAPVDAGLEAAAAGFDSGADGDFADTSASLECPGDLSSAADVPVTVMLGAPPPFTAGALQDGAYVLTAYTVYDLSSVCALDASAVPPIRGAFTVASGTARLDLQEQGQPNRCFVEVFRDRPLDAGTNFLSYSVSSDGLTVSVDVGGSSCSSSSPDGQAGTTMDIGTFVHP